MGHTAKLIERYAVKLYALAIEGNHIQAPALFPKGNRADFMRDWNSAIARAVHRFTPEYRGGRFWGRRYSNEFLPGAPDIEEYFFYTVLQPVQDGLVEKISDYPGYNCFHDAVWGIAREFKIVRWAEYNEARRYNTKVALRDYIDIVTLRYERLPGYEDLTQQEYVKMMHDKLERRRAELVQKRFNDGLGFAGRRALLQTKRGAEPRSTKRSNIHTPRPRVLSVCPIRGAEAKAWYFSIHFAYKAASAEFRAGNLDVAFPIGTYRPYLQCHPPDELV